MEKLKETLLRASDTLKVFFSNRTNAVLAAVLGIFVLGILFAGVKFLSKPSAPVQLEEVEMAFDPEGPYGLLVPRRDGYAATLYMKRVASFESVSYELAYQAQGTTAEPDLPPTDRGVQGDIDTKAGKGEFQQEILFGTCSQGYTNNLAHCVFDKNVENGTLTLKIKKKGDNKYLYKMITTWHFQQPDIALGELSSGDGHFVYKTDASREELALTGYAITNDLSGMPKLPDGKTFLGKVYALNIPEARSLSKGDVMIELADNPPAGAKLARYNEGANSWEIIDTKIEGSKLSGQASGKGVFAVLIDK